MASSPAWKDSLTASERYENIQRIGQALARSNVTGRSAFELEDEAYRCSTSHAEYDAAVYAEGSAIQPGLDQVVDPNVDLNNARSTISPDDSCHGSDTDSLAGEVGEKIGDFDPCRLIGGGVTSEVYRCRDKALKVIVETRKIEPHNPFREADILNDCTSPSVISLLETFRDQKQRFVLVFPYMPLTLAALLDKGQPVQLDQIQRIFRRVLQALDDVHSRGIIHRDIKPSAVLLASPDGPAYVSDFGSAWHPRLSASSEPADQKILDVGTGPYRAPEVLFGDKSYGPPIDLWGVGCMLAESCRHPPRSLFESRPVHEDGNQLGLILSIFKRVGSPTGVTWPEAARLRTSPFEMYRQFDARPWSEILPEVKPEWRALIASLVKYGSGRVTAKEALQCECFVGTET